MHFRKQLKLQEVPQTPLIIQITADTKYKLYVNHRLVHAGPVKGDEHMWFYDELDVQPHLKQGTNLISVRVLRFFYATSYATSFPRLPIPGLFIRTPDIHERQTYGVQSGDTWDCALDMTTVLRIDQKEDDFMHVYENVSADQQFELDWVRAKVLPLPKSHGLAPPWILRPRQIPVPKQTCTTFKAIHNTRSTLSHTIWENTLVSSENSAEEVRLPAGSSHHLELEAEHHITAMLSFIFTRPKTSGSVLRVTYSECYEDEPEHVPYVRKKENRTDTNKNLYGPQDQYAFAGKPGADVASDLAYADATHHREVFSPFHFRTLRYLSLDIDVAPDSDLVLEGIRLEETHYPLDVLANFQLPSSDPHVTTYQTMWENSVRTLKNCMHDCYEDCPFYEQLQYAMDVRSSCLFTYAISGDDRMARQAIMQLHNSYRPEIGLIASRSPAHQLQLIPHFSLFWICTLTDHYEQFADKSFTLQFLATADSIVQTFAGRIDDNLGLIASRAKELGTTWDFVDWAPEWKPMGVPPQRTGFQTFTSMIYAYTLKKLARVVQSIGRPYLAQEYDERAGTITKAVQKFCWNGEHFTDGLAAEWDPSKDLSEQIQIWAVLSGTVQDKEARTLLSQSLLQSSHHGAQGAEGLPFTKASMAMSIYALRAMSEVGGTLYDDSFHAFWEPWRHQISQNMSTWCEDNVTLRSDCHAWSSTPLFEFMTEVAGITPSAPGWSGIAFKPRVKLFSQFSAHVPLGGALRPGVACVQWDNEARNVCSIRLHNAPVETVELFVSFHDGHVEQRLASGNWLEFSIDSDSQGRLVLT